MLKVKHGSPTVPMPGYQVDVVDEASKAAAGGHHGFDRHQNCRCRRAACRPCGSRRALPGILFPGIPPAIQTSDAGYKDEDGYVFVMGRTDDIITSPATGFPRRMEEILAAHPDVAECAGARHQGRDQRARCPAASWC